MVALGPKEMPYIDVYKQTMGVKEIYSQQCILLVLLLFICGFPLTCMQYHSTVKSEQPTETKKKNIFPPLVIDMFSKTQSPKDMHLFHLGRTARSINKCISTRCYDTAWGGGIPSINTGYPTYTVAGNLFKSQTFTPHYKISIGLLHSRTAQNKKVRVSTSSPPGESKVKKVLVS